MLLIITVYIAGGVFTFLLIAVLRGRNVLGAETDSVSALVAAVVWPFALSALTGCMALWWLFDVTELLFYTVSTWSRNRK